VNGNKATINVKQKWRIKAWFFNCSILSYLTTGWKDLGKSKEQSLPLNVNETKTISSKFNITIHDYGPLDDPYLYRVIVEVKQKW